MKIIEIKEIERLYSKGLHRTNPTREIVIHGTAGGASADALIRWMLSLHNSKDAWEMKRAADYKKGVALFHAVIDFDGTVYQLINPDNWVYHSQAGKYDANTIGIELMNNKPRNAGRYTQEQYKSLAEYIEYLERSKYHEIRRLTTHDFNAWTYSGIKKETPCPGPNFDWNDLCKYFTIETKKTDYGREII